MEVMRLCIERGIKFVPLRAFGEIVAMRRRLLRREKMIVIESNEQDRDNV